MSQNLGDLLIQEAKRERTEGQKKESVELRGHQLEVRSLSVGEANNLTDDSTEYHGKKATVKLAKMIPALWYLSVYDDKGERVFRSAGAARAFLENLNPEGGAKEEAEHITNVALRLSGLDKEAEKEAEKNSEEAGED